MRSLAFFIIPISVLFLLVSLGLVADGIAQLSDIVKYYNSVSSGSGGSRGGGGFGGGGGGGGGGRSTSYRSPYSTQYSDGGGVFGSGYSSYSPYTYSSFDPDIYSTFDYDSALSSIYSKYSYTFTKRQEQQQTEIPKRASPTIAPVIRQFAQSTPTPFIKRMEEEVEVPHQLQKRASIVSLSQAKSRFAAILAFYVLQLVTIVALLVTGVLFMIKFRKIDEEVQGKITSLQNNNIHANTENLQQSSEIQDASSSIFRRTTIFRKFFLAFIILTVLYFIFGIVSFALLGSISIILGIVAATIAFWVFAFLACVAICITLVLDRRTSEEDETALRNPSFDGGEYGNSKSDGMIISSPQQQNNNNQPVSMPQPQTPAGWQQSTAEHQQQYASVNSPQPTQQSGYPTYTPTNESQPSSPPPQQTQPQTTAGPIEGQIYRAVVDEHGNTQMVPVNL